MQTREGWQSYSCFIEGHPTLIEVDSEIGEEAPLKKYTKFISLEVFLKKPDENGLACEAEISELEKLKEKLLEKIEKAGVFVGTNTAQDSKDFLFYATENNTLAEQLSKFMKEYQKGYEFKVDEETDTNWERYFGTLYPSEEDWQSIVNKEVIRQLAEHGDALTESREIDHWIYFVEQKDQSRFVKKAKEQGYQVRKNLTAEKERDGFPFGVQLYRDDIPSYEVIDKIVFELYELAEKYNGDYDGWETSVEIPNDENENENENEDEK